MIAAAMTSHKFSAPTYVDLAKAKAKIQRDIAPDQCERLQSMSIALSTVKADLGFSWDDQGRINVAGTTLAVMDLMCQACSAPVTLEVEADVVGILVRSELEAQMLKAGDDELKVIVVSGPELNEIELVEDELLLRLPSQICVDAECERRPKMSFGPAIGDSAASDKSVNTYRPFAGLAELQLGNATSAESKDKK